MPEPAIKLNEETALYVLHHTADIILWVDKSGFVFFANQAAEIFFSRKAEAFSGQPIYAFLPELIAVHWPLLWHNTIENSNYSLPTYALAGHKNASVIIHTNVYSSATNSFMSVVLFPVSSAVDSQSGIGGLTPDILLRINDEGKILHLQNGIVKKNNLFNEGHLGKTLFDALPVNVAAELEELHHIAKKTDLPQLYTFSISTAEGIIKYEARIISHFDSSCMYVLRNLSGHLTTDEKQVLLENKFQAIFNNSFQFMGLMDLRGNLLEINEPALIFLGLNRNEIVGKQLWKIKNFSKNPNTISQIQKAVKRAASGEFIRLETNITAAFNHPVTVDLSLKPVLNQNGTVEFIIPEARDITEQKFQMDQLRRSQHLYRTIAENLPNGLLICFDKELRYTLLEGQALERLGYNHDEMLGKRIDEVAPVNYLDSLRQNFTAAVNGEVRTFEINAANGDNYFCTVYPLINDDFEVEGGMLLGININRIKKTETELEARIDELNELNKKLKKEVSIRKAIEKNLKEYSEELKVKNLELEQFAYVASHDLQEPLRMIASFTQLLGQKYKSELGQEADEFIDFILEGAQRMQKLINDLLIYSRVGRKGKEMKQEPLDEIIESAKENISLAIDETDTQIIYENMPSVYCDASQMAQLFQNLFSNAIKFRRADVIPQIKIEAKEKDTHWVLCVTDNGIGIDMKHKDRIFNIFQRLHSQEKYPGTGIGLAICKKIVERHGGEIWVESEPGRGSSFCFSIKKMEPQEPNSI